MKDAAAQLPAAPDRARLEAAPRRAPYLKSIRMTSFGAFKDKVVGPFSPHLNVVFGRNEAGKTTVSAFVRGVLFGWEEARGTRNTYRPSNAERAGSLIFAEAGGDGSASAPSDQESASREWELSRIRNSDGLKGEASLVADIDKETYTTMFSLNSDELRTLRGTTNVTAKLLTAGSGTGSSPTEALAEIQRRLAELTSRSSSASDSLANLAAEIADVRTRLSQAYDEAANVRHLDKEFAELEPERAEMLQRIEAANDRIERLTAQRAAVERIDQQLLELRRQRDALREDAKNLATERRARLSSFDPDLLEISASSERALRDQIEALAEEQAKHDHSVDLASENFAASTASYEALMESQANPDDARQRRQRNTQVALSVVLPVAFALVGVWVFFHGRQIASLSFTGLGAGLVIFSLFLAAAALVMLFRPSKEDDRRAAQERDAHWVMLQDRKKLETVEAAREACAETIRRRLDEAGLESAEGSLRRARSLLDEAHEGRAERELLDQRRRALVSRLSSVEEAIGDAEARRACAFEEVGLDSGDSIARFDEELARASRRRSALLEASDGMNRRYGELKQTLAQARGAHRLDELKLEQQQLLTRQEESARAYATLLLARRMLQAAIATWESKSQPEVYRQASRYLSLMTDGHWEKVSISPEGKLQVVDAARTAREPVHLSLGTRQQLYLALRIALLQQADNVGCAIPVFADDILVNFDARRRRGAARALAELARTRQVVLFTCHEEVVKALRKADPDLTELEL